MNKALFLLFSFYILVFAGCATAPYTGTLPSPAGMPGIYHRVERGQTLWRISKIYNLDLDEIATVNHIPDTASIEEGQLIFIPNRQKQRSYDTRSSSDDFAWPLRGKVITAFGQISNNMINKGVNIQPSRNSDVLASRSGRVSFYADDFGNFGKTIIIEHGDGFSTVYTRNSEVFVKAGDSVQKGTVIARVGSAGRDRNTYLHFEIRKGHIPQNPFFYLP
jgi:LysM repeat protein